MQETIINAHRLIGETVREPGEERRGRIVGVDQSRSVPVIFVIWQGQEGIHRVELTVDELRQLAEACNRHRSLQAETGETSRDEEQSPAAAAVSRRRVGSR
ncbi:hypothetical protein [Salinicola peritrichatus]|uniref:hypothetical protein n=1 Tax=Salinicola peritrichatus TaxID=1267424 RepID=UPI000DA2213B|nr:hypothetical protein [Salinicola peritrichatus]